MGNAAKRVDQYSEPEHVIVASDNFGFSAIAYATSSPQTVFSAASAEEAFYSFMKHRFPDASLQPPTQLLAGAIRGDMGMRVELQNVADIR